MRALEKLLQASLRAVWLPLRRVLFGRPSATGPSAALMALPRMLADTTETEIGCDEVYELLDRYAEMADRGEDTASLLPLVHQHLERCRDCREELEALLRILKAR